MVHPLSQLTLVVQLYRLPFRLEIWIFHETLDLAQAGGVEDPLVSFEVFSVEIGEEGVGAHDPSSGGDAVGDVDELGREELVEIFEESGGE